MTLGKRGLSPDASIPYITQSEANALRQAFILDEEHTDGVNPKRLAEAEVQRILKGEIQYEVVSEDSGEVTVALTDAGTDTPARPRATRRAMQRPDGS